MIRLSSNIRTQMTMDGGVVLDLHRGKMFQINPTGAAILNLLAHGSTEEQIIEEICRNFSAEPEVATTDVRAFLASLAELQLL
jgi:Coenzyme PQQ synthesis protein D (PqqD)